MNKTIGVLVFIALAGIVVGLIYTQRPLPEQPEPIVELPPPPEDAGPKYPVPEPPPPAVAGAGGKSATRRRFSRAAPRRG